MMSKVLVEIYNEYGKQDGDSLISSCVTEDTKEMRKELMEEWSWSDSDFYDNIDDFINGKENNISFGLSGGDWDDPTGREIVIITYEDKREQIEREYKEAIEQLNTQFKIK